MATKNNTSDDARNSDDSLSIQKISELIESKEDFPVDFNDAWQWIGYKRKDIAKEALTRDFVKGVDYLISFSGLNRKTPSGGRSSELIVLTIDCFKSLAMMAGTAKGKEVRRYFLECEKELLRIKNIPQPQELSWFNDRLKTFRRHTKIPTGYFCIFEEIIWLVADLEDAGCILPNSVVPDISVGKCWCNQLRKDGFNMNEIKSYPHRYPGWAHSVPANIYPNAWLPKFREWFENTYKPLKSINYLRKAYPQALPSLCKVLRLPEAQ